MTWEEVADAAGVTPETLRRNADSPAGMRTTTRKGIERALRWKRGSIKAILSSGEPTNDEETDSEPSYDERLDALEAHARETLEQIEAMRRERARTSERRRTAR